MDHQLLKLKIKGYKSIKDLDLELCALNVLIGQNGAGKSNFIQMFSFLRNIIEGGLQETVIKQGGANTICYRGYMDSEILEFSFNFDPNYYHITLSPTIEDDLFINSEEVGFMRINHANPTIYPLGKNKRETSLSGSDKTITRDVLAVLQNWYVYHFHDTSTTSKVKRTHSINSTGSLAPDASNLAAFLFEMKQSSVKHYERIVKNIRLALPFFNDFYLKSEGQDGEFIRLKWTQKGQSQVYGASALSDGSLRFICLTVLLMQPTLPQLVLIDEPELGLHPSAIGYLAAMIRRASKQSQIIISTQSPGLVSEFEPEDVIVVELGTEGSTFKRLNSKDLDVWLEEYSLGEIWDKNLIGGKP